TLTILLVNKNGIVTQTWVGKLAPDQAKSGAEDHWSGPDKEKWRRLMIVRPFRHQFSNFVYAACMMFGLVGSLSRTANRRKTRSGKSSGADHRRGDNLQCFGRG